MLEITRSDPLSRGATHPVGLSGSPARAPSWARKSPRSGPSRTNLRRANPPGEHSMRGAVSGSSNAQTRRGGVCQLGGVAKMAQGRRPNLKKPSPCAVYLHVSYMTGRRHCSATVKELHARRNTCTRPVPAARRQHRRSPTCVSQLRGASEGHVGGRRVTLGVRVLSVGQQASQSLITVSRPFRRRSRRPQPASLQQVINDIGSAHGRGNPTQE